MNGLTFLGTSGQNIRDMMLNSLGTDGAKDEGTKCLDTIKQTLEMRHLMPTAPDTLRVYPFQASDPFVVSPLDNNLNLGEDEEQAEETSKTQFTQVPHVYFVGNMEAYKEELIVNDANCQQCLKVISLPTFAKTHSIVLLDL
jgi:DNA polymerase II small subunit/DNA polymerase delta subunit B